MKNLIEPLKEVFVKASKRVLKENISRNPETLNINLNLITNTYNNLILEIRKHWELASETDKQYLKEVFIYSRNKIVKSYAVLNCNFYIPTNIYNIISPSIINSDQESKVDLTEASSDSDKFEDTIENFSENKAQVMEFNQVDLLKLATTTINKNYSGDPSGLQAFIDSINLLSSFATTNELRNILVKIIVSKLEGKARECILADPNTVEEIVNALKSKIKSESSKVIEGRMQALRTDRNSLQDFSKKAEDLADHLRRSLIMEGISANKAQEMTIDKTVEMCRASARSDLVKAILASTHFSEPKEVIAKFIVEINNDNKEKQVLAYRSFKNKNYNPNNSQRNSNPNNSQTNSSPNNYQRNQFHSNYPSYQNKNRPHNTNYNDRFQNSTYYQDNSNAQYKKNYYRSNYNNKYQQPSQNVRYLENSEAPQWQQDQEDQNPEQLGEEIQE